MSTGHGQPRYLPGESSLLRAAVSPQMACAGAWNGSVRAGLMGRSLQSVHQTEGSGQRDMSIRCQAICPLGDRSPSCSWSLRQCPRVTGMGLAVNSGRPCALQSKAQQGQQQEPGELFLEQRLGHRRGQGSAHARSPGRADWGGRGALQAGGRRRGGVGAGRTWLAWLQPQDKHSSIPPFRSPCPRPGLSEA